MLTLHIRDASTGVDLHLAAGWTGVVGATRADELAFLSLAVREPDEGRARRCPPRPDAIAAALAGAPDVLVIDDGHERVDADDRPALVAALRDHRGVGLIAVRDRPLLDELTTATIRVERGVARLYPGGYATARAAWQAEGEQRGRQRAAAATNRQQVRLAEQAHQATLAADHARASRHLAAARGPLLGRRTVPGK